jgi:hypothetical protein
MISVGPGVGVLLDGTSLMSVRSGTGVLVRVASWPADRRATCVGVTAGDRVVASLQPALRPPTTRSATSPGMNLPRYSIYQTHCFVLLAVPPEVSHGGKGPPRSKALCHIALDGRNRCAPAGAAIGCLGHRAWRKACPSVGCRIRGRPARPKWRGPGPQRARRTWRSGTHRSAWDSPTLHSDDVDPWRGSVGRQKLYSLHRPPRRRCRCFWPPPLSPAACVPSLLNPVRF